MSRNNNRIYLVLENIRSVHNVGSIFRTADAAGISKIYLSGITPGPTDRFGNKRKDFHKTALGAEDSVESEKIENSIEIISKLKNDGFKIIALEQDKNSIDYKKVSEENKVVFILGSEVDGVSKEILNLCDHIVEIPMNGEKESLNVGVAFGIAIFRILGL